MAVASKYKFADHDSDIIANLGYSFQGINQGKFAMFMRKNYPGFNLAHLLNQVENLMVPHAGGPVMREIIVKGHQLQIKLQNNHGGDEDEALVFDRKFFKKTGTITVSHEFLIFPKNVRNQGLSRKVLKASLEQYKNMDAATVKVICGLSAGAFVWAKAGFVAVDKTEMKRILTRAKQVLTNDEYQLVKEIFDDYYDVHDNGTQFPIRRWAELPFMELVLKDPKSQWEGRLDLKNKEHFRKFEEYVSKQK